MISVQDLLPTAILIPSLNRPQRVLDVIENIESHTHQDDHERFWCVGDEESLGILHEYGENRINDSDCNDKRYVTRMNKLVARLQEERPEFKTVFFGSDDVYHHHGWLENALEVMAGQDEPSVVVVNDMRNPSGTQALMRLDYIDRAVFDAPGLAFHPNYRHQFADTEQFATALAQGEHARAMASCVEHLHPLFKQANSLPDDDTYKGAQAWSTWLHDTELWKQRQAALNKHFAVEVS